MSAPSSSSTRPTPPITSRTTAGNPMAAAPAMSTRQSEPKRVVRREYLRSSSLAPEQRCGFVHQLYEIYSETTFGCTYDEFAAVVFSAGDGRFVLCYGEHDEFAGFSYTAIDHMEHQGRTYAVMNAGVFFRPGYHGGSITGFFGLRQALRFKLRHPLTQLAYVTRCSTPAVYRLLATVPRIYPNRNHQTPADVEALARAACAQRKYVPVGTNPWVVRSAAVPRDASRLRSLEHDPDVRFYNELAPGYAEGTSLVVWLPLDVANIAGGFVRLMYRRMMR